MYLQSITWQLCCPRTLVIIANNNVRLRDIKENFESNLSACFGFVFVSFAFYKTKPVYSIT